MNREQINDAQFEIEHISGLRTALQHARERFDEVGTLEPLERVGAFRHAIEATRDDFDRTFARIDRWWRAFDCAFDKLIREVVS